MSNFALDVNSSQGDIISSLNYALANMNTSSTNSNLANVVTANVTTGAISTSGSTYAYLYQYMNIAYANTATGGGFTSNSANQNYYGIHNNTANIADLNPTDYVWTQVAGGFGTTKGLYYQTLGGRQISFNIGTSQPGYYFKPVIDNVPVNLDNVTTVQAIYNATIYQRGNTAPTTPTGGTYDFGNLILTPPAGWSANIPSPDANLYTFGSQNTFLSSEAFVNGPSTIWTSPIIFSANGQPGVPGHSYYNYNVYTTDTSGIPATPLTNTGSYNFTTGVGTPPLDPNYFWGSQGNISLGANITGVVNFTTTVGNYTFNTFYGNSYSAGPYSSPVLQANSGGIAPSYYSSPFTISSNSYVDILIVGGGGVGGTSQPSGNLTVPGGGGGHVTYMSNVLLPAGSYYVTLNSEAPTALVNSLAPPYDGPTTIGFAYAGITAANGNGGDGAGGPGQPSQVGNYTPPNGGVGVADPTGQITWVGQIAGNGVAYFGGGGGAGTQFETYGGTPGLGGGGYGGYVGNNGQYGVIGTGGGGGGNNNSGPTHENFGSPGLVVIREYTPQVNTWANVLPQSNGNVYVSFTNANIAGNIGTASNLVWSPPALISGSAGAQGSRGFIPMAYVATPSNPTSYTDAQYTAYFAQPRTNVIPPIGTGYYPITGDVAQFVYTPTNTIIVKTFNSSSSPQWTAVDGQVISGNVFVTGSINATALNANDVFALNIASTSAAGHVGDFTSPGFWLQASSGNARIAGNTNIGGNLTIGNSAIIGNYLTVGADATIGNNLNIGNNTIIGNSAVIGQFAVIGNSAAIGNNAFIGNSVIIGNNLTIGNNTVVGNNLTVGNNTQIGGNLQVAGLITSGNLNNNTVNTNTIVTNAVTQTGGFTANIPYTFTGQQLSSLGSFPPLGTQWITGTSIENLTIGNVLVFYADSTTTTNIINAQIQIQADINANVSYSPFWTGTLFRFNITESTNTQLELIQSPTYNVIPAYQDTTVGETITYTSLNVSGLVDTFTSIPGGAYIYLWLMDAGAYTTASSANVYMFNGEIYTQSISYTYLKR